MEIIIALSALIANGFTKIVKPNKAVSIAHRAVLLRVINAVAGLSVALASTLFLGEALDVEQIQSFIEVIFTGLSTFAVSQIMYFLSKKI